METRNILNYQGQVIGQMQKPDGTSNEVWAASLAPYAATPMSQQQQISNALQRTVEQGRKAAELIIEAFKKDNLASFLELGLTQDEMIMQSCWIHHRLREINYTIGGVALKNDLLNLCISGDLETAYVVLGLMSPDDMSLPYHFFSQAKIDQIKALVAQHLV